MPRTIHVVGDRFTHFAQANANVITITQLEEKLVRGELSEEMTILVGQGIQHERLQRMQAICSHPEYASRISLLPPPESQRAEPRFTHKRLPCNVMITLPQQVGESLYRAWLMVDDECAEMSDHLTGQHIQGMVLAEAGRQIVVAVAENFLIHNEPGSTSFFVINAFDASFHSFAFPVITEIECKLLDTRMGKRGTLSSAAEIRFIQGGECVTSGTAKFSAYDSSFMRVRESNKARQLLTRAESSPASTPAS
ncbi:AfsA-related hotdog domain-containing protein [Hyalangium versicolor]|uniref:AfsA-related hotdog domain-containing protein n=1 Tax=Hyalangium versicolor TaxID=2861190 RepID=UPI001CC960D5|nr:AfsA-related hotdog domain-containing protein [Hyalangium versicolor]